MIYFDTREGILTGPLSTVWQEFVRAMVEIFDYEPGTTIVAAPYDFRLAPSKLQQRDYFFRRLMVKIENTVEAQSQTKNLAHRGLIVMAHSMGTDIEERPHCNQLTFTSTHLSSFTQATTSSGISSIGSSTN
jgi:hypothetical protein